MKELISVLTFGFSRATHVQQVNTVLAKAQGKEIDAVGGNYTPEPSALSPNKPACRSAFDSFGDKR